MGKYTIDYGSRYILVPKSKEEALEVIAICRSMRINLPNEESLINSYTRGFVISDGYLMIHPVSALPGYFLQCDRFIEQFGKKRETINLFGKDYDKEELENALAKLSPIEAY